MPVQRRIRFEDGREATLSFESEPSAADLSYAAGVAEQRTHPGILTRAGKVAGDVADWWTKPPAARPGEPSPSPLPVPTPRPTKTTAATEPRFRSLGARQPVPFQWPDVPVDPEAAAVEQYRQGPQRPQFGGRAPEGEIVAPGHELPTTPSGVIPAPVMQSAVEGGAVGALRGTAGATALEWLAGAAAGEVAEPAIESIPGEGPIHTVLQEALRQAVFMAPGMGAEHLIARWRGPRPDRLEQLAPKAEPGPPAPEQVPPVAVPGSIEGGPETPESLQEPRSLEWYAQQPKGTFWFQGVSADGKTQWVARDAEVAKSYAARRGPGAKVHVYSAEQVGPGAFANDSPTGPVNISPEEYARDNWSTTIQGEEPKPLASFDLPQPRPPAETGTAPSAPEIAQPRPELPTGRLPTFEEVEAHRLGPPQSSRPAIRENSRPMMPGDVLAERAVGDMRVTVERVLWGGQQDLPDVKVFVDGPGYSVSASLHDHGDGRVEIAIPNFAKPRGEPLTRKEITGIAEAVHEAIPEARELFGPRLKHGKVTAVQRFPLTSEIAQPAPAAAAEPVRLPEPAPIPEPKAKPKRGKVAAAPEPEPVPPSPQQVGRSVDLIGQEGNRYQANYRVVSLDDLRTNHPDVQPRSRGRAASREQIAKIGRNLDASEYFAGQEFLDRGGVLIKPDLKVVSGNGRTLGIRYARENAPERYRQFQIDQQARAAEYGLSPAAFEGVKDPIIVRHVTSPIADWKAFAEEANASSSLGMSPAETAIRDARSISPEVASGLHVGETQTLEQALASSRNAGVVRAFLEGLPANERATLQTADGAGFTPLGLQRIKAALLARAFPGPAGQRLVTTFTESTDSNVKNVETAIFSALPDLAKVRELVAVGKLPAVDLGDDIAKAVDKLSTLRTHGVKLDYYLAQQQLGQRELTPLQEDLLRFFDTARSAKPIRELLQQYTKESLALPDPGQMGLGGIGTAPTATKEQLLARAQAAPQADMFGGERGAVEIPSIIAEPAEKIRSTAIAAAKWITPKSFATEDAINIAIRAKGEKVEQARVAYNQRSRGNEAFFDRLIGKEGKESTYAFIGRMMRGEKQPTPALQEKADFYRHELEAAYEGVNKIKALKHRQNYWPFGGMWKAKDADVQRVFSGRRPMAGSKSYFRKKVFEDIEHGLAAGLEPVSPNPEVLIRSYLEDVRRFQYANKLFTDAKSHGLLTWKRENLPMPEGKTAIDDPIVRRYFPPDQVPVSIKREELLGNVLQRYMRTVRRERVSEGPSRTTSTTETTAGGEGQAAPASKIEERVREALTARGFASGEAQQYIDRLKNAKPGVESRTIIKEITERTRTVERTMGVSFEGLPEDVRMKGRVMTQRFIPAGQWVADDGFARLINNSLSPDNLRSDGTLRGVAVLNAKLNAVELLGGFHVQNEAWNIWASKLGQASRQLGTGHPWVALKKALAAPGMPLVDVIRGGRLMNSPDLIHGEFSPLAHGMRLAQPTGAFTPGSAVAAFMRAWRRRELGGVFKNIPGAVVDGAMAPIFKFMVPRMQVAAYYDILADEFDRNAAGIADGTVNPHTLARKTFESVQNRMGMVNYDSWFWNHTFKSLMQSVFRAPGWNFGYGFEIGGGVQDLARNIRPPAGQPRPGFTPKMQFWVGMGLAQIMGAEVYQVLRTGKHLESLQDVYAPRNGQIDQEGHEVRVRFANVFKDVYGATHDLLTTMFNKLAPVPVELVRIGIANRDYFGDYIRNKDDPAIEQAKQVGQYAGVLAEPFSLQQFLRGRSGEGGPQGVEAAVGVTRAPREMMSSESQQQEERLLRQLHRAPGPRTPEQKAEDALRFHARMALQRGDEGPLNKLVEKWVNEGLPQKTIIARYRAIVRAANETPEQRRQRMLGPVGRQQLSPSPLPVQ